MPLSRGFLTLMILNSFFHTTSAFLRTPCLLRNAVSGASRLRPCLHMCQLMATQAAPPSASETELIQQRLAKTQLIRDAGLLPFEYSYDPTHSAAQLAADFSTLGNGEVDDTADVALCGRIMTRRMLGKLAFFTIQDSSGTFQLYLDKKRLGERFKPFLAHTDAGDIVVRQCPLPKKHRPGCACAPLPDDLRLPLAGGAWQREADGEG